MSASLVAAPADMKARFHESSATEKMSRRQPTPLVESAGQWYTKQRLMEPASTRRPDYMERRALYGYSATGTGVFGALVPQYPTEEAVCSEIIQLGAVLSLPKGTEHFMSDLHGEDEAFRHILNNCSGVIREKVDAAFGHTVPERERAWFAAMIYYPEEKIEEVRKSGADMTDWYSITLYRLTETARLVASKYTRSKVRAALPERYADVLDELLYTNLEEKDKAAYVQNIVSTIVETACADEVIEALCALIKRLAVDRLHIVGDVFDRGRVPTASWIC